MVVTGFSNENLILNKCYCGFPCHIKFYKKGKKTYNNKIYAIIFFHLKKNSAIAI